MLVVGQMHLLTVVFLLAELSSLPFLVWYCYAWPQDKTRLWFLILVVLLVVYNLTGGLMPDPDIGFLSIRTQNIIAYGSGFMMASYFPYYFYRSFNLDRLRFQAIYGVPIFLILPFLVFFALIYAIKGDLEFAIRYGLIVPFFYSLYILWAILSAIREKFRENELSVYPCGKMEIRTVYFAVFPWVFLSLFAYFHVPQWIEVLFTNIGFVVLTFLFMRRSGRYERMEKLRQLERDRLDEKQRADFEEIAGRYELTKREIQIADLLCRGMTYKQIGETLFISEKTVDVHVQNIFLKTGVNKKIDLQKTLGFGG